MYSDHELIKLSRDEFDLLESWELKPDWRFRIASRGIDTWFASEQYIAEMMDYLHLRQRNRNELPDSLLHVCYQLWSDNKKRIVLEAYIIAGATNKYLLRQYPYEEGPEVFEWYRKLFFDIDAYQNNDNIILAQIIGPLQSSHINAPSGLITLEYLSKRLATYRDISLIDDFDTLLAKKQITKALRVAILEIAESSQLIADLVACTKEPSGLAASCIGVANASRALAKEQNPGISLDRLLKRLFDGLC